MVKENDVDSALKVINRLMGKEGMFDIYRLNQYYEKPFRTRRRENYEKARAIYNEDMERKVQFIMRKNRVDPWIGSS